MNCWLSGLHSVGQVYLDLAVVADILVAPHMSAFGVKGSGRNLNMRSMNALAAPS